MEAFTLRAAAGVAPFASQRHNAMDAGRQQLANPITAFLLRTGEARAARRGE